MKIDIFYSIICIDRFRSGIKGFRNYVFIIIWFRYPVIMKKAKKRVARDYIDCMKPKISKSGFARVWYKNIQFGKISAQRLVITAVKIWSHWINFHRSRICD